MHLLCRSRETTAKCTLGRIWYALLYYNSFQHFVFTVKATLTGRLNVSSIYRGITNVEDKIYVLADTPDIIKVYEDRNDFRFIEDIALNETGFLYDIVYNNNSKCVYISDRTTKCIWAMTTTPEHRLTKWLTNVNGPYTAVSRWLMTVSWWLSE